MVFTNQCFQFNNDRLLLAFDSGKTVLKDPLTGKNISLEHTIQGNRRWITQMDNQRISPLRPLHVAKLNIHYNAG